MKRIGYIAIVSACIVIILAVSAWLRRSPGETDSASSRSSVTRHLDAPAAPTSSPDPGASAVGTPAVPGVPLAARPLGAQPLPALVPPQSHRVPPASVWSRLENPQILRTELRPRADGNVRRARLLRTAGKYAFIVFEGALPGGDPAAPDEALTEPTAKVADHVILRAREGVTEAELRRAVAGVGLSLGERLTPEGPYLAHSTDATLATVDAAIRALEALGAVAYAEPDYIVYASDIPAASVPVDVVDGEAVFSESALDATTMRPPEGPVFDMATQASRIEEGLLSLPGGTRVLGFDPPGFTGGAANYNPSLEEQNFTVSESGGVFLQSAYTAAYPNNGTVYARSLSSPITVKHREGLPFRALSVDLSEYSTSSAYRTTLTITGYRAYASPVTQSFTTDGIMDGTGPLNDFQTATLSSSFTNLTSLVISSPSGGFMVDNVVVQVEGQETPAPPAPTPPLISDTTWDPPKHTVHQLVAVSGHNAPASVNFGTPTVRAQVGTLPGPVLELKGSGYQQVRFAVLKGALTYRLEFDAYLDLPGDLKVLFDSVTSVQNLYFKSDGTISAFQSSIYTPPSIGTYARKKNVKVAVDIDMVKAEWEIFVDGVSKRRGPYRADFGDLRDIRFHTSDTGTGFAGIDNVRIYAYGPGDAAAPGPRLAVSPDSLTFSSQPVGTSKTWNLSLRNTGSQALVIQSIASTNSAFSVAADFPITILPGGNFYVNAAFAPQSAGAISGSLRVSSNDPAQPVVSIPVSGSGIGVPRIALTPANLDVTMLANSNGTQTFTLNNPGAGSLIWNLVLKGAATQGGPPTEGSRTPNDTLFSSLWAMGSPRSGQGGIDAVHAWSVTTGAPGNIIAVIDTGVDRSHPELQGNLWVNGAEIPGNGIDDDGNGRIDDVHGWDFANKDNDPTDGNGHGTHVAGTIAARGDNALGVAGVCWAARILPVKFLSDSGSGYTSDAVAAVSYATQMGARISNNSWGGGAYSQSLSDAIRAAGDAGALFVAAAGNSSADNDTSPHYPSSYALDNIVAVAATDYADALSHFSNYGVISVDLAAPGSGVLSLRPGGQFAFLSGTSMAAPHVTGTASLLLSQNPALTPAQMKQLLQFGSDPLAALGGVASRGRLNAYRALKAAIPQWLQPALTSGTTLPGQSTLVPLAVNTATLPLGNYAQTIALTSNDPARPAVDLPVSLKVIAANSYHEWQVGKFASNQMLASASESALWSATADPDGDGASNLIEFITGRNPNAADAQGAVGVTRVDGENVFEFYVSDTLAGASYAVEWSLSLAAPGWRVDGLVPVAETSVGMPPGTRRVRVKLADPAVPAAFFRLVGWESP